jgi:iron complex outermembrane receptor protein
MELFADALYSQSKVTQTYQPSPARASFFATDGLFATNNVVPALLLYPSNLHTKRLRQSYLRSKGFDSLLNGNPLSITSRVFDFGPRQNVDTAKQSRLLLAQKVLLPIKTMRLVLQPMSQN